MFRRKPFEREYVIPPHYPSNRDKMLPPRFRIIVFEQNFTGLRASNTSELLQLGKSSAIGNYIINIVMLDKELFKQVLKNKSVCNPRGDWLIFRRSSFYRGDLNENRAMIREVPNVHPIRLLKNRRFYSEIITRYGWNGRTNPN